jgi:hypothetical protein
MPWTKKRHAKKKGRTISLARKKKETFLLEWFTSGGPLALAASSKYRKCSSHAADWGA